jgi:hypothetical protein
VVKARSVKFSVFPTPGSNVTFLNGALPPHPVEWITPGNPPAPVKIIVRLLELFLITDVVGVA